MLLLKYLSKILILKRGRVVLKFCFGFAARDLAPSYILLPKPQLLGTITIPVIKPQNARKRKLHAQIQVPTPAPTSLAPEIQALLRSHLREN